ncbi:MAG: hypothetical protein JWM85_1318 [Acidimicrobiaceae bacterium]|nr:hypothetical protein [Acidimicrobiaceae bacterium]
MVVHALFPIRAVAKRGSVLFVEAAGLAQKTCDRGHFIGRELFERRSSGSHHRVVKRSCPAVGRRLELHENPAAIVAISCSADEAGALEAVEHERHGAGGRPATARQLARAQRLLLLQKVQTPQVGPVDGKVVTDCVIESVNGTQESPKRRPKLGGRPPLPDPLG